MVPAKKRSTGKIVGLVAAAVVLGIIVLVSVGSKQVTVPDLSGITLAEATARLQSANLTVGNKTVRDDSSAEPNASVTAAAVSVNVAVQQVHDPGLVHDVRQALAEFGLPPARRSIQLRPM